jgi:glutamyl-tRNA synthetase
MMHVGGVRTALFAWLYARQHQGQFILRIEDTDKAREVDGSIEHIIEALKWLGIEWDEGVDIGGPYAPYLQSERLTSYQKYARLLIDKGLAYPDPYTAEEVDAFRAKAEQEKRAFLFRDHRPEVMGEWDGSAPLRFRVPEIKKYEWTDMVRGTLSAGEEALDDFILIKADGYPTYNFAHIIDDHEMEITHIMRGEEFISSTPKFLSLYDALEFTPPQIATMPVILGSEGTKKLGKRDGAKDILEYRDEGILPEALLNYLALLGWHPSDDREILSKEDLLQSFDITRLQKGGAQWSDEKLLFINREWMRALSDADYVVRGNLEAPHTERLMKAVPLLKERAQSFLEAQELLQTELAHLFSAPTLDTTLLSSKGPGTKSHLEKQMEIVSHLSDAASHEEISEALMAYADTISKEDGGRGAALWPLRYALSGLERSPDPFTIISIIGTTETVSRIETAISLLS